MKKIRRMFLPVVTVTVLIAGISAFTGLSKNKTCMLKKSDDDVKGTALVELFTSEGCSSCPPADALLKKIASAYSTVTVLSFHVDYWNRLGWKDPFSNPAYSERQRKYVSLLNSDGAYTPQAVVNGRSELVGSDGNKLQDLLNREIAQPLPGNISIKSSSTDGNTVSVSINSDAKAGSVINLALVQKDAASEVSRGENRGRHLVHVNLVRDFITEPAGARHAILRLPAGTEKTGFKVVAFIQDNASGAVRAIAGSGIE